MSSPKAWHLGCLDSCSCVWKETSSSREDFITPLLTFVLQWGENPSFSQWLAWTRNLIFLDRWQYRIWIPPLVHTCVLLKRSGPLISAACYWPFSWTYGQHLCHISPTLHHPAKLLWKHFSLGRLLCFFSSIIYNTFSWIHNSFFWLFACALAICLNLIQLLSVGKYR